MLIAPGLELIETAQVFYGNATVRWVFDTNSSVIRMETLRTPHISSEHWITENSDIFSFTEQGELACLALSVPGDNHTDTLTLDKSINGQIKLHNLIYSVPPTKLRLFDPHKKLLSCFMQAPTLKNILTRVQLGSDFAIILADDEYFGFELSNPLDYLASQADALIDPVNHADTDEYLLMGELLDIISDNNVDVLDNDMASVANELKAKILPKLKLIKSPFREATIKCSLEDFIDYYA